jgi:hypothetical protein
MSENKRVWHCKKSILQVKRQICATRVCNLRNAIEVAPSAQRAKELLAHRRLHEPVLQVLSAHSRNVEALREGAGSGGCREVPLTGGRGPSATHGFDEPEALTDASMRRSGGAQERHARSRVWAHVQRQHSPQHF